MFETKPFVKKGFFASLLLTDILLRYFEKNFMALFYGWGSTASRLQPLRGGSLLFTIQFPEIPGAQIFGHGTPGLGIQRLSH